MAETSDVVGFYDYSGWAPCFHTDEEREHMGDYLVHGSVDDLMAMLCYHGATVKADADQWWGISVEDVVGPGDDELRRVGWEDYRQRYRCHIYIQADTLHLALTEAYLKYRARWEEVKVGEWEDFG